jgi:putative copper resistance protein D
MSRPLPTLASGAGIGLDRDAVHVLYLLAVWLHILAAVTWIGGMFFLVLVVVPWLRGGGGGVDAARFLRETGRRFRNISWVCFAVVVATGTFALGMRGVRPSSFVDPDWLASSFGRLVLLKLTVFAVVLVVSLAHDLVLGPRATTAIAADPRSEAAATLRRRASLLARMNVLLALVLVALGDLLVRGWPW